MSTNIRIFIDADACPVKDETYKVAERYSIPTIVVANSYMRIPRNDLTTIVVVDVTPDAADDHIAEQATARDIVITADVLLAARCVKTGAITIAPNGKPFSESSIGNTVATRNLMTDLRSEGGLTGGPPPFSKQDRSKFLQALDQAVTTLKRSH